MVLTMGSTLGGAGILLTTTRPIRKCVVERHMIHLRGGLVVPACPGIAGIECDHATLVAGETDNFRIDRIDPQILVVVATGCAPNACPGFAGIGGSPGESSSALVVDPNRALATVL